MKYDIGQKVRVRYDISEGMCQSSENDAANYATDDMCKLRGRIVTIIARADGQYRLKEFPCMWVDTMFEPVDDFDKNTIDTDEIVNAFNAILIQ